MSVMATRSPNRVPSESALFRFVQGLLHEETPASIARRAGVQAPTLYRWSKSAIVPDQLILLERVLQACGYGLEVIRLPPPDPEPFRLVVPDDRSPTPPVPPAGE